MFTKGSPAIALALALAAIPALAQDSTPGADAYADAGPYAVATVDSMNLGGDEMAFEARLWYPQGEGPFPVIVFSHGLGGSKDVFGAVTSHWASHGYVVIQPSHDDAGIRMTNGGMHPPEAKVRERLGQVITALDSLERIAGEVPALDGRLDSTRLGVAGHSYGSFITMLAGGLEVEIGGERTALGDARVNCLVPISPSGRGDYGIHEHSFETLTRPALFFTGTRDLRNGRADDWRMEPYNLGPGGDKYLVVIEDASHGQFGGDDASSDAPDYVKAATAAFWDHCLRGEPGGREYLLEPEGFAAFAGGRATLEAK